MCVNGPVFSLLERLDFAVALHDQAQCHGLHASGGEAAADFVPQQRRDLIADDAVEDAAGLLRVYQVTVNLTRMPKGLLHRFLRDLIKGDAVDGLAVFFLLSAITQLFSQMRGYGFAFAVRVRGQINRDGSFGQLFQLGHNFLFAGNDDVLGGKVAFDVHTQLALRQVFDVAKRGFNFVVLSQVLVDGFRLGRRFDDD